MPASAFSVFLATIFVTSFIFQLTVIPETLQIKGISRIFNAALLVSMLSSAAILWLYKLERFTLRTGFFYVFPLVLIMAGYGLNLLSSATSASIGYFSILIPPAVALVIPFLKGDRTPRMWDVYYRLMLVLCAISITEYILVFGGILQTHPLFGREGYLRGVLTTFYDYGAALPHYRLYGTFFEPGTGALLVVPAMTYALMNRKFIAVLVFLCIFLMGNSLGGYAALAMVLLAVAYVKIDWHAFGAISHTLYWLLLTAAAAALAIFYFLPQYSEKTFSATVREQNILGFFWEFPNLLLSYPTGFLLKGDSLTSLTGSAGYLGSNFMPYVAFVQGGILSLMGYVLLLAGSVLMSIRVLHRPSEYSPVALWAALSMPALLVFSFQRASVFETILLGFLFGSPILESLRKSPVPPLRSAGRSMAGQAAT